MFPQDQAVQDQARIINQRMFPLIFMIKVNFMHLETETTWIKESEKESWVAKAWAQES